MIDGLDTGYLKIGKSDSANKRGVRGKGSHLDGYLESGKVRGIRRATFKNYFRHYLEIIRM